MTEKQVWLVTGDGRGLGIDIAQAALAAGHAVVATARSAQSVTDALGEHEDLLAVALDVTDAAAAGAAVHAAVERFGHLDVLVNNAGSFNAGFFEEMTAEDWRAQIETHAVRPGQRHPCRPSADACPARRPRRHCAQRRQEQLRQQIELAAGHRRDGDQAPRA